ncbi:MAG: hypothetical protein AAF497_15300 [Planctomycetota bacterium]
MTHQSKSWLLASAAAFVITTGASAPIVADELLFWSTQARPVEEAQAMRDDVLAGFGSEVDYQPQDTGPYLTRLEAEFQSGTGTIGLIGGLHGDISGLGNENLVDLSEVDVSGLGISETLLDLGSLGSEFRGYTRDVVGGPSYDFAISFALDAKATCGRKADDGAGAGTYA